MKMIIYFLIINYRMHQEVPEEFLCPITLTIMENPVTNVHGHTFDRDAIMKWYALGSRRNPLTNMKMNTLDLAPNMQLKKKIDQYRDKIKSQNGPESQIQELVDAEENKENQNPEEIQRKIRKMHGTLQERMEMKKKEINVFKHNFKYWKKQFDKYINEHHNHVVVLRDKVYLGEFKLGRRHGKGICYYRDGSKYQGEWLHDYYYGKGIFHSHTGKIQYGEWRLGDLQGVGIYEDEVGFLYEGDLKHGTQSGWGVVYQNDKIYFEGEWRFGLRHGKGIRYMLNGQYEGNWRYGVRHGNGLSILSNGTKINQKWFHGELSEEKEDDIQ